MWIELLFFSVFFVQILLISYYFSNKLKQRMSYVFAQCPYATHKKMYPKGYENALKVKFTFSLVSHIILLLGIVIFVALSIAIFSGDAKLERFNFVPLLFGLIQAIPLLILEVSGFKQLKQMRELHHDSKRTAELNPRKLFSFISPMQLISSIVTCALCVFLIFKFNDYELNSTVLTLLISLLLCNSLFVVIGYKLIHGKKMDPHQSLKDRHKATEVALRSFISVSILVSVFFIFNQWVSAYSLDIWEPILNSLYWLLVMLLSSGQVLLSVNLQEIDFDVYKTSN